MLQQTQVATVIPFFLRWMERFPDFASLAEADEEEVLRLWEGLGYYRRARSLRAIARRVMDDWGGNLPRDEETLLALPGVGPYTAGALLSLAFNVAVPALDGNVERVMTRLGDRDDPVDRPPAKRELHRQIEELIPTGRARDFNQALMELGALVCLPRRPLCPTCPWRDDCLALRRGTIEARPVKSPRPPQEKLRALTLLASREEAYLLVRHRRDERWAGLWEFPTVDDDGESLAVWLDAPRITWTKRGTVSHAFTRFRRTLTVFSCQVGRARDGESPFGSRQTLWVRPEELNDYPLSAGSRKARDRWLAPEGRKGP
jgi:A/G-specific adenine glycosylase